MRTWQGSGASRQAVPASRIPRRVAGLLALLTLILLIGLPAFAQDGATALFGTIRAPSDELSTEGITVTASLDGETVGEATTDENGTWEIEVPEAGTYTVTVDEGSLPEGVVMETTEREREVQEGKRVAVVFSAADEGAAGAAAFETLRRLVNLTVSGLQLGAIIAITSIGLSLVFGVTGLVNFAHGEMVGFGALVAYYLNTRSGPISMHLFAATPLAVVGGAGMGYAMERGLFGPLRRRRFSNISLLVISIGLSILLRYLYLVFYGGSSNAYRDFTIGKRVTFGPISTTSKDLVITGIALGVLVLVGVLLTKTKLGTAMRATADNRDLAASSGIDVQRVILATWIVGGGLAALGGVLQGLTQAISWDMGFKLLLLMFAAVILGGIGTAFGAMVGGLAVGVVTQVSTLWFSVDLKLVFAFGVLIVVLLFRPQGILGRKERIG